MAFDPQFLSLMTTTAQWYDGLGSEDFYATPALDDPQPLQCHVTYKRRLIRTDTEQDKVSNAQLQCPPPGYVVNGSPTPTITVDDYITLPFDGVQRKILDVTIFTDDSSGGTPHHQSISLE